MAQNYGKNIFGYDLGDPNKPDEPDFYDPSVGIDEINQYNKEIANYMANGRIGKSPGVPTGIQNPLNVQVDDGTAGVPSQLDELMSPETNSDLNAGNFPIEVTKAALPPKELAALAMKSKPTPPPTPPVNTPDNGNIPPPSPNEPDAFVPLSSAPQVSKQKEEVITLPQQSTNAASPIELYEPQEGEVFDGPEILDQAKFGNLAGIHPLLLQQMLTGQEITPPDPISSPIGNQKSVDSIAPLLQMIMQYIEQQKQKQNHLPPRPTPDAITT
jgi:hypothetical protein